MWTPNVGGGVARKVAKYKSIEIIDQAEIDGLVPEITRKYFPNLASGFDDSRHNRWYSLHRKLPKRLL